jgi:G:T-mismatch repair DNA endonuclease (very short patch repair protein)
MSGSPRPDPETVARLRRQARRKVARACAWHRHRQTRAAQQITGRPARAFNRLEARFAALLDHWGLDYQWQFRLGPYVYDFELPGRRLVEVHGTYWHADPRFYPPDRLHPAQRRTVLHDLDKLHFAARSGYRLKVVWEHDLKQATLSRAEFE